MYRECNFDGLVGPTHNYAGLSYGNLASISHRESVSFPRQAAWQGLAKMKLLADAGYPQGFLPPQERPYLPALRELGFSACSDGRLLVKVGKQSPVLLAAVSSASSMWTANAATVAPSCDTLDGKVHFTPANLASKLHRFWEAGATTRILRTIFHDRRFFVVHNPLPACAATSDEGGANHMRLAPSHGCSGLHVFVHGRSVLRVGLCPEPERFPARQTLEASEAVARRHQLSESHVLHLCQNPGAVDAGAFHNDVVAVGNLDCILCHEMAFARMSGAIDELKRHYEAVHRSPLQVVVVPSGAVSLSSAIKTYLFNSQLLSRPTGGHLLLAPSECEQDLQVCQWLEAIKRQAGSPIQEVRHVNVRQSMQNGGGPACLRLRIVLNDQEWAAVPSGVWLTDEMYVRLHDWIGRHYREELHLEDLADPHLLQESRTALDELTCLTGLGSIYEFQYEPGVTCP